ncbi:MAG TPA: class I SAM-dependent methyltransferase [candidate division Zixibacteria bacterium]|nr:class I SAM-dependent methyltransferase [candidate division Zixibacteria bacterium]
MRLSQAEIERFFDNPLKRREHEREHDAREAEHFDAEADRFIADESERALYVDFDEPLPPRHRAFWIAVGRVEGKRVLDVGCGYGYASARLALCGAEVTAIDVSPKMCELTRRSAELNGVDVDVLCASASDTGLQDESFDLVVGQVSLHHLTLETAGPELARVLRPGGRAIFLEPLQVGKFFLKLRSLVPVPCKESPGGGALRREEIAALGEIFGDVKMRPFGIVERLRRVKALSALSPLLYAVDGALLAIPGANKFAAQALIVFTKNHNEHV